MLPVVLLLLGLHSSPGEPSSRGAPEWLTQGLRTPAIAVVGFEESALPPSKPAIGDGVSAMGSWISGLPVHVDVKNGGFCVALRLHAP